MSKPEWREPPKRNTIPDAEPLALVETFRFWAWFTAVCVVALGVMLWQGML